MKILSSTNATILLQANQPGKQKIILCAVWVIIQCFLLWHNGIVTSSEATKYINQATIFLASGHYSSGNFLFYSIEILLIAACLKLKLNFLFVVFFQILVNGISMLCFYKLVFNISRNSLLSFAATLYFLSFFYYHLYNTYLFTESLFFSFSVIYTYFLFGVKKLSVKNVLLIILLLSILYVTRPTGLFFIPATYIFLVIKFYARQAKKIIAASLVLAIIFFYFLFNFSLGSGGELDFLLPYLDERIICGVPTISKAHDFSVPFEKNSIAGLFYIISHHLALFLRLAVQRLIAFFGIYRPFYSAFHNIIAGAYFYFIYVIILFNVKRLLKNYKAEVLFLLTNAGLLTLTVMLSCDEWSNRFILSVLPLFLLLAVISVSNYKNKLSV